MPALFAFTLAVSAALLFSIQPMVARMALPILGGTPAVWNTCMVFFQASVLAGYGLAHLLATRICPRPQAGIFLLLILGGGLGLPVALFQTLDQPPLSPLPWLLGRLTLTTGLPALALATASPLLQRWYGRTRPRGGEPYFLYAASNIGSLGALLAYPTVLERFWPLAAHSRFWTTTYIVWGLAVVACAAAYFHALRNTPEPQAESEKAESTQSSSEVTGSNASLRLRWVGLAAVPASLLQGCTLFLTTDLASIPLLWIIPLALYLLTFVITFALRGAPCVRGATRVLPFLAAALLFVILARFTQPVGWLITLHLAFLVVAGLVCHGRLVALRPEPSRLTGFYFAMSLGGVLGGAFSSLIAPHLFRSVAEYPLAIAVTCFALPFRWRGAKGSSVRDLAAVVSVGVILMILGLVVPWLVGTQTRVRDALVFGVPAVMCCTFLDRPRRLALSLAVAFVAGLWVQDLWTGTRRAERNFFGITRVTQDAEGRFHHLVHGSTLHGRQSTDPSRQGEPLSYYHRNGPLGWLFDAFHQRPGPEERRIGVIGLGVGSSAAYARSGEDWTFFEIDPAVIRVAQDPRWFTYLKDCRAERWRILEGDARLRLAAEPDNVYDLLLLDAFSSDAIPVHLLTREALDLYLSKLRPGGWIAAHISNRYLNLEPVFAAVAKELGLACRSADDVDEDPGAGKEASHWVILARSTADLGRLSHQSRWVPAQDSPGVSVWTDQRAGILDVFDWH